MLDRQGGSGSFKPKQPQMESKWIGAAIAGAVSLASMFISNAQTKKRNKEQREWNEEMWEKQNAYDSPAETRKRLQQAGLNPALIYGQGSSWANSANPETYNPETPPSYLPADLGAIVQQFRHQDIGISKTQSDINLNKSIANRQDADALKSLKSADLSDAQRRQVDALLSGQVKLQEVDYNLKNIQATNSFNEEVRKQALHSFNVQEAEQKIRNIAAQISKTEAERRMYEERITQFQLDNDLRRKGFNPNSPTWQLIIGRWIDSVFSSPISDKSWWQNSGNKVAPYLISPTK